MAIPVIYKGDDTDFRESAGFTLKVVTSSNLNLSGCTVEVEVLGFRKSFPASATGELVCPFAFTAAETQRMPLGIHAATVRVYDSKGRVRTINNSIRVKVTNVLSEAYGKDDPQEVTLAVSAVDLEAYAKKDDIPSLEPYAKKKEVTAAIEKAMKDASASVKLHVLTPEVADTTVTLKPVDGVANHVDDVVGGFRDSFSGTVDIVVVVMEWNEDADTYIPSDYHYNATVDDVKVVLSPDKTKITMEILRDFDVYGVGFFTKGTMYEETAPRFDGDLWFADFPLGLDEGVDSGIVQVEGRFTTLRSLINVIPADATKARKFTLAVETDTETENAVTWQGGEVIEAVPGASNLVPGLNVWDVAEVAPGKFRVDRASTPAQSAPLTLTAPNGRVAELTVDDDLILEVKEK